MKNTFYYIAGRFCASGLGFNYCEREVVVLEVRAVDYKDAEEEVKKFCYMYYGYQETGSNCDWKITNFKIEQVND